MNLTNIPENIYVPLMIGLSLWGVVWKGLALWKAAAIKRSKVWFVLLLVVVNTVGILEILYFFVFSSEKFEKIVKSLISKLPFKK